MLPGCVTANWNSYTGIRGTGRRGTESSSVSPATASGFLSNSSSTIPSRLSQSSWLSFKVLSALMNVSSPPLVSACFVHKDLAFSARPSNTFKNSGSASTASRFLMLLQYVPFLTSLSMRAQATPDASHQGGARVQSLGKQR